MPGIWTKSNDIEFAAAMTKLALMFNRTVGEALLGIYREELNHFDGDQAVGALERCLTECERWPVIAVVINYSGAGCVSASQQRIEARPALRDKLELQGVEMSTFMERLAERRAVAESAAARMLGDGR